jgi:flagellar motor switch protein FliG
MAQQKFTGPQKAARLLVALGPDISAGVFKHLKEEEINQLTVEIAKLPKLEAEERQQIIAEFRELLIAQEFISRGGIEYAKEILTKVLGPEKAEEVVNHSIDTLKMRPFDFMKKADSAQLTNFLIKEHPQTVALILSYLEPPKASEILSSLPEDMRGNVARRLAQMKHASPEFVTQVVQTGGVDSIVSILQETDRETEKAVIDAISETDPELAEEVKKKMFTFEDLVKLDDRAAQRVLREVDTKDLAVAMKGASEAINNLVFRNMPKRAAEMLREEISYLGPMRLAEVEEAQQKVIAVVRQLEESGEIMISRGGKGGETIIE